MGAPRSRIESHLYLLGHLRHLWRRVRRIRDAGLMVRAWLMLRQIRRLLAGVALPEIVSHLQQPVSRLWNRVPPERIRRCVGTVVHHSAVARRNPCLFQSLLLYSLLHQHGATPELFFGVRRETGELVGHCWIALDGKPMTQAASAPEQYAVTFSSKDHSVTENG